MSRKISVKRASLRFIKELEAIEEFLEIPAISSLSAEHRAWCYDYAIIRTYRGFEEVILKTIIAAINNSPATISHATGISFPRHLSQDVCRYLVLGNGYFDFKGRDGLIGKLRRYLPENHFLVRSVKDETLKQSLERLSSLRNLAAHDSIQAKRAALKSTGQQRLKSTGHWLLKHRRCFKITNDMKLFAADLWRSAPF
jgi:hypothetical protein